MSSSQEAGGGPTLTFSQPPCDLDFQGRQLCARRMGVQVGLGKLSLQMLGANPRPLRPIPPLG